MPTSKLSSSLVVIVIIVAVVVVVDVEALSSISPSDLQIESTSLRQKLNLSFEPNLFLSDSGLDLSRGSVGRTGEAQSALAQRRAATDY